MGPTTREGLVQQIASARRNAVAAWADAKGAGEFSEAARQARRFDSYVSDLAAVLGTLDRALAEAETARRNDESKNIGDDESEILQEIL